MLRQILRMVAGFGCLGVLSGTVAGCVGQIGERPGSEGDVDGPTRVDPQALLAGVSGLRRLTVDEYDSTLRDLIGDDTRSSGLLLPTDKLNPFDNDYTMQKTSAALIEAAEALARDASARLLADPDRLADVVGCTPTGAGDADCLRQFITVFGRKAIRRSLEAEEIDKLASVLDMAVAGGDFHIAVDAVVRALLQHPEFLYRVEIGTPIDGHPGLSRLTGNEVATRLAYLMWGSTPDDWMIDLAEDGQLETAEQIRAAAAQVLDDPRARRRITRFHALWLGYESLPHSPELSQAMRMESDALVERIVFDEELAWQDMLRFDETFVSDALAEHYGIDLPGSDVPVWTSYGASERRGILSHGTFLSNGAKFADTSPTLRGLAIRTRLLCQTIPPPPPGVSTDEPIEGTDENACKKEKYTEVHAQGGCASCHSQIDPIGFGLENYDQLGRYRTHDVDAPECIIDGIGEVQGVGTFEGPAGLEELLLGSDQFNRCVVSQLYRFAMGHEELDDVDEDLITALTEAAGSEFRFDELLLDFVSHEAFHHRREP